jgi:hypothetical protein
MGIQTDYFDRIGYKPTYFIGDRVIGKWNKIPFVGTVGNDRQINLINGPEIVIFLDLPLHYQDQCYQILIVKHKQVRKLPELDLKK